MIYRRKYDKPTQTIRKVTDILASVTGPNNMPEFPIIVTKDENVAYFEVWEAEAFDLGGALTVDAITKLSITTLANSIVADVNRIRALRRRPTHRAESFLGHIEAKARAIQRKVSQKPPPQPGSGSEARTAPSDRREPSH